MQRTRSPLRLVSKAVSGQGGYDPDVVDVAQTKDAVVPSPAVASANTREVVDLTLESLFRQYSGYVAAIALRLLGRDGDVDDVVQEVFLGAWKGVANLRDPGAVKGWLATVTVRIARRKLRMRRVKQFFRFDDEPTYEDIPAPGATPEEKVLLARVYEILDGIPVDHRLAWTLRHVEREQLDDVARLCGCSLATAKRRITAAQQAIDAVIHEKHEQSDTEQRHV
jgi:RNA polymerase sigma-70 factor, ECF subfamily